MKVYLLRHGKIETPDQKRRYIGLTDLPLSEAGRLSGEAWAEAFIATRFDRVYASPLIRCADTARSIAAKQGVAPIFEPQLMEIHLGEWEGLAFEQVQKEQPLAFEARIKDIACFRPPKGESFYDCQKRALGALNDIFAGGGENICIVAHAGINRAVLCHYLGMELSRILNIAQDYACLNMLSFSHGKCEVEKINMPVSEFMKS